MKPLTIADASLIVLGLRGPPPATLRRADRGDRPSLATDAEAGGAYCQPVGREDLGGLSPGTLRGGVGGAPMSATVPATWLPDEKAQAADRPGRPGASGGA